MLYKNLLKPLFFRIDPEKIHHFTLNRLQRSGSAAAMKRMISALYGVPDIPALEVSIAGLSFRSPIGLAAGLDKNAQAVPAFSAMGFGYMEVGTVTPQPQPGNDKPRLFRLPDDTALINRMGFNNDGAVAMAGMLQGVQRTIPVGINIGKNKTTANEHAVDDYLNCIRVLFSHGDFFVVNISSPNTPDLRKLQHGEELQLLLTTLTAEMKQQNDKLHNQAPKPLFVKLAPDLSEAELEQTVATILQTGVSGIIATNTTLSREGLQHLNAKESGGLSGAPLTKPSTEVIQRIYRLTKGKIPIIGVGGIFTAEDAFDKIKAGADAVEIYTSFIYEGPGIVKRIHTDLARLLEQEGFRHISEAVGTAT